MDLGFLRIARYRLRILLRAAFLLLALATIGLAVSVLQQEKQLSYDNYQAGFQKSAQHISATLRHPAGQLALLNPPRGNASAAVLHPVLLPFGSLDFDDQNKVQQAIALSGCLVQYGDSGNLCVGVGSNAWAGGFVYVAGSFDSARLVPHRRGDEILDQSHRVLVSVALRGKRYDWIAPFEEAPGGQRIADGQAEGIPVRSAADNVGPRGRLTGFKAGVTGYRNMNPVKDFRGWIWQSSVCNEGTSGDGCAYNSFFSLRLPVGVLRDALFDGSKPVWPPEDLDKIDVQVRVLPPGDGAPILDSTRGSTVRPFALTDLKASLLPGETLRITKAGQPAGRTLIELTGDAPAEAQSWRLLTSLIRRLPVASYDTPLAATETIAIPSGRYEVTLQGDARSVSKSLSVVASRLSWFVGAMLLALLLAWLVIEVSVISRIRALIRRANAVARTVRGKGVADEFDVSDLRGEDELGVLATCLHDLLRRVREDVERETIRAEQERDMWHAVGHEIMSPLQSLMALDAGGSGEGTRYLLRMQQAIRVLYGEASPSEAFQASVVRVGELDLEAFLRHVAANAPAAGIDDVEFYGPATPVLARADEYCLEDVVTHVLRNAARYRVPGSPITITLEGIDTGATISIADSGPQIADDMIGRIFEYGVSDQPDSGAEGNRGQGLFVAKTYMAKMGGTIGVANVPGGVVFTLNLQRAA